MFKGGMQGMIRPGFAFFSCHRCLKKSYESMACLFRFHNGYLEQLGGLVLVPEAMTCSSSACAPV
jgi:hypothetical protein